MFRATILSMGLTVLALSGTVAIGPKGIADEPFEAKPRPAPERAAEDGHDRAHAMEFRGKFAGRAVAAALDWLARHQDRDGHWSLTDYTKQCKDKTCTGVGSMKTDSGATALGLLPFLAAGQTHMPKDKGPYREHIFRGLYWLMKNQGSDGNLAGEEPQMMYSHGLATLALCEAYGATNDRTVGQRAQLAVEFIEKAQHPETGGWRYVPGLEGDTSVLGCQLAALASARKVGLKVAPKTFDGARKWLKSVAQGDRKGLFSYLPEVNATPSMTAVGLLCSQRLGAQRDDPAIAEGVAYLDKNPPDAARRNCYYWCYATQAMHNVGGPTGDQWNRRMRRILPESQIKEGCAAGSWDPKKPNPEAWGEQGGRIMVTSFSCLTLEVSYRYLRIWKAAEAKPPAAKEEKD